MKQRAKKLEIQKKKDEYDINEVKRDLALIKSPCSKLTLKDLVQMAKKKAKVKVLKDDEELELDVESDDQYNYSDQEESEEEMEMEAEMEVS